MLIRLPRLRSLKSLAASRDISMTPVTLVAKTASKLARSWSTSSLRTPMPALLIRTSRSPSFLFDLPKSPQHVGLVRHVALYAHDAQRTGGFGQPFRVSAGDGDARARLLQYLCGGPADAA
jgi:hypothetical protein